ncbi:hypothetical protein LTR37_004385 [Vermiconidia calcicola]|uniref:Uncharacterized protein n=1 Tax=Vermiconidia calcicola TaxID=1690605 RepID=A0ACC3NMG1_9PEZI|nr:hypothetical protein LTR37_004385 [Vermiconidia calcicola]
MTSTIGTRFFVLSDTHGDELSRLPKGPVDVAIHCGDLTEESKLDEFRASVRLLKEINAPLKLVIAGNHDFTMDVPMFQKKLLDINPPLDDDLVQREYGAFGKARELFEAEDAKAAGIVFLDEGTHRFALANGALLTVYASPYTASVNDWGSQYNPQQDHEWAVDASVDVVITHGPPKGVLDYADSKQRAGSQSLFAAIARARPSMHCFGHIHEAWGAKKVTWRSEISETPSHFTDIDNDESTVIETLAGPRDNKFDSTDIANQKQQKRTEYNKTGYCAVESSPKRGTQTLFVNAAIESLIEKEQQLPWIINLDLPKLTDASHNHSKSPTPVSKKRRASDADAEGLVETNKRQRRSTALDTKKTEL